MMTLDKFDYVLAVAEERNLRRAASRLYISQPGLTAYLNRLEQHLGVKLFNRNVNPIQITEAGALYIAKMKELQKSESMLRMMLQDMGAPKRTFRIGIGMSRGMQWLPILLPALQKMHPDISVNIQGGGFKDMEGGIQDGSLDVIFGAFPDTYPEITYEMLRRELIYCIVPRTTTYGAQFTPREATIYHPAIIDAHQLSQETALLPSPVNGFYDFTERLLAQYDVHPANTVRLNNMDTAYRLAANGSGWLVINAFDYHRLYPQLDGKLAFCIFSDPPVSRVSKMAYRKACSNMDLIEDLRQIVRQELLPLLNDGVPTF